MNFPFFVEITPVVLTHVSIHLDDALLQQKQDVKAPDWLQYASWFHQTPT